tara:strand:+ start:190 stop:624 length:435 start_codon:yes stop_codon:yes gene_type:complete
MSLALKNQHYGEEDRIEDRVNSIDWRQLEIEKLECHELEELSSTLEEEALSIDRQLTAWESKCADDGLDYKTSWWIRASTAKKHRHIRRNRVQKLMRERKKEQNDETQMSWDRAFVSSARQILNDADFNILKSMADNNSSREMF